MLDRTIIPLSTGIREFRLPLPFHGELNGSGEYLLLQKENLPMVQLNALITGGSKYDPAGKGGTAYLLSSLLDEGAGAYNALELSSRFERLGTRLSVFCNHDDLVLSLTSLEEYIEESARLMALVMHKPRLEEKDFSRERTRLQTALLRQKDEPSDIADLVFDRLLFPGSNAYGEPLTGTLQSTAGLLREDVMRFFEAKVRGCSAKFSVVGNVSPESTSRLLNDCFPEMRKKGDDSFVINTDTPNSAGIFIVHKPGSVQTEIRLGHTSNARNDSDYFAKYLVNFVLGGQFNSRLNKNLREVHGYTYGISSNFLYHREQGYFSVSTSVGAEQTGNALKEIMDELNRMLLGPSDEELTAAKKAVIRRLPAQFESYAQTASNLSLLARQNLPLDYFSTYPDNIIGVSLKDAQLASAERLKPDAMTIVLTGDREVINDGLKAAGFAATAECTDEGVVI